MLLSNTIQLREWSRLDFLDPEPLLVEFRRIQNQFADADISPEVANLRTNPQKEDREVRQAALFSFGMGCRLGVKVGFAPLEASDYDFVTMWESDSTTHFCPVQLKELVPDSYNSETSVVRLLEKIRKKYPTSNNTVVAIYLNRIGVFVPDSIAIPELNVGGLYFFGSMSDDQSRWTLIGDLLGERHDIWFDYPGP